MKAVHIVDGPPLYTNCFLLIGDKGNAVAIDPAADAQKFITVLEQNNAKLSRILLTHAHHDHIGSVETLREKYGAKLSMNEAEAAFFNMKPDEVYQDMGTITVDDMTFTTIFTPGHTVGSTCIACGDLLFTGDTLFAGDIGRCDLPGGDLKEMVKSLRKLCSVITEDLQVLPGHEEFSTMDIEKENNPYLQPSYGNE